jgi:hypothetical protein
MTPPLRQRLLIAISAILGGMVWLLAQEALTPPNGSTGLTLWDAQVGLARAVAIAMLASLPAVLIALICSATGNPLTGIFAVAAALMILAGAGGPIDGLLWRASLPGVYGGLMLEIILWFAALAAFMFTIQRLRPRLRRLPGLALWARQPGNDDIHLTQWNLPTALAGLISTLAGGLLCVALIQSTASGQVIGSMLLAFAAGALIAHMTIPKANPIGILLSPALVALLGYGYMLIEAQFVSTASVLEAWYAGELPGVALALPIHYASAAVAGCTLGLGVAQALHVPHHSPAAAAS